IVTEDGPPLITIENIRSKTGEIKKALEEAKGDPQVFLDKFEVGAKNVVIKTLKDFEALPEFKDTPHTPLLKEMNQKLSPPQSIVAPPVTGPTQNVTEAEKKLGMLDREPICDKEGVAKATILTFS